MGEVRMGVPDLGVGVGLRVPHYREVLSQRPAMDFFEVISENFMVDGGKPLYHLDKALESYPIIQHGVSLGIGSPAPPSKEYLAALKKLVKRIKPAWLSDHFCWAQGGNAHVHDLLPLPATGAMVRRVVERARQIQDFLEVPFALENASSYMNYRCNEMTEWEFISEVVQEADIGLLFDVNNVYVSAYNHGFDAYDYIRNIPHERIVQIHLAGHTNMGAYIIDTHNGDIIDPVWQLYEATIARTGPVSTLIEWDDEIPAFGVLSELAEKARALRTSALKRRDSLIQASSSRSLVPTRAGTPASPAEWVQGGRRELALESSAAQ